MFLYIFNSIGFMPSLFDNYHAKNDGKKPVVANKHPCY